MSIVTEPKALRRLTVFIAIIGVAMIIPSNLAFASPDDGSDDSQSVNQEDGQEQEEQDDQTEPEETDELPNEEPIEELPPIDEVPIDPCVEDPDACALEPEPPADPCLDNPNLPECQSPADPCLDNPNLPECQSPIDPCVKNPDLDECKPGHCIPEDPTCIPILPLRPTCPPGFHFHRGLCIENPDDDDNNGGSSSKTTIILPSVTTVELSSCRLDGNAHGMQQKFDIAKYRACGIYPNGQLAYTDGFVMGCTQIGNTQQLCQAFVVMNTQQTPTTTQTQTQPITQSTTQSRQQP